MTNKLMPETRAPSLNLPMVGGGTFDLASDTPENFTMVVFYRGYHCPLCKAYLGKLEELMSGYTEAGFKVVAASMNTEDLARRSVEEWGLKSVPVAYGLTEADAKAWGLYISTAIKEGEAATFSEPGLFWVRPDGTLYLMDVSNMPFARPDLKALLDKTAMVIDNGYPARGTKAAA